MKQWIFYYIILYFTKLGIAYQKVDITPFKFDIIDLYFEIFERKYSSSRWSNEKNNDNRMFVVIPVLQHELHV